MKKIQILVPNGVFKDISKELDRRGITKQRLGVELFNNWVKKARLDKSKPGKF